MKQITMMMLMILLLLLSGCVSGDKSSPAMGYPHEEFAAPREESPISAIHEPTDDANAYYYYMASVLKQKAGDQEATIELLQRAIAEDPKSPYLKMELLNFYLLERDIDQALAFIDEVLAQEPDNAEALLLLGKLHYEQENYPLVAKAYERLLEIDPSDKRVYLMLGEIYLNLEDKESAERVYGELIRRYPDFYAGYFFMGKLLFLKEAYSQAEASFKQTLALNPELEDPRYELLKVYKRTQQPEKSVAIYQEMLEKNSDDVRAKMSLGLYYRSTDPDKSAQLLKELGEQSLNDPEILRIIVQDYFNAKEYADVVIMLTGMLQGAPDNADIFYFLGVTYGELKDGTAVIDNLQRVGKESDFYRNAVVHQVYWLQETGRIEEAAVFLEKVVEGSPDNPDFLGYLGAIYEEMKDYENAINRLKQGIELYPENSNLHFRLGVVMDKLERKNECIDAMKKVIELDPKHANALNYLGYTYAEMGVNLTEAEQLIKRALVIKPNDGYITDSLGWVYFQRGEYLKAVEILEKAIRLVPDDPTILEHIGDAYLKIDNFEKALEFYQRSLTHKKDDKGLAELEQKIKTLEKEQP